MALKITAQIGTDKGITSEAYVRIADYQVSKYGSANFRIEIYQTQEDVPTINFNPGPMAGVARNQQIGDNLFVALTKQENKTVTVKRTVPVETPSTDPAIPPTITYEEQDVEETVVITVPDLSSAEAGNIFEFGYSHLKTKLSDLFGADNVVDC